VSLRFLLRALAAASAGALALTTLPAQAAGPPGWRVFEVFGNSEQYPSFQGDAATGPSDAWVVGTEGGQSLVVYQWNGTQWQSVTPPAGFTGLTNASVNDYIVSDSSPADVWTFPVLSGPTTTTTYALQWNGSAWTKYRLAGGKASVLTGAAVGPAAVWAFGERLNTCTGLGFGPPWAEQFNGTTWRQVSMPGTPLDVSAISATDMWAYGTTRKTACQTYQTYIAMRWDGTSWRSVKLPKLAPVDGHAWYPAGLVAVSDSNVWVSELVEGTPGVGGGAPPNVALLHWNGTAWTKVAESAGIQYYPGLTSDGDGGFWLSGSKSGTSYIVHYGDGKWTRQKAPTKPGYTDDAGSFVLVPGTTSVWGLGGLERTSGGSARGAILEYGN
jgi:hypothetical protein